MATGLEHIVSLSVDTSKVDAKLGTVYSTMQKKLGETLSAELEVTPKTEKARAALTALGEQLTTVTAEAARASKRLEALQQEAAALADVLVKDMPAAAKILENSLGKSAEEVKEQLQDLQVEMTKAAVNASALSTAWKDVLPDDAEMRSRVEGILKEMVRYTAEVKKLQDAAKRRGPGADVSDLAGEAEEYQEKLARLRKKLGATAGEDNAKKVIAAFAKDGERAAVALAQFGDQVAVIDKVVAKFKELAEAEDDYLSLMAKQESLATSTEQKIDSLAAKAKAVRTSARAAASAAASLVTIPPPPAAGGGGGGNGGDAGGPPGGAPPGDPGDPGDWSRLIASMQAALRQHRFELLIDEQFLLNQLIEITKKVPALQMPITPIADGAAAAGVPSAAAIRVAGPPVIRPPVLRRPVTETEREKWWQQGENRTAVLGRAETQAYREDAKRRQAEERRNRRLEEEASRALTQEDKNARRIERKRQEAQARAAKRSEQESRRLEEAFGRQELATAERERKAAERAIRDRQKRQELYERLFVEADARDKRLREEQESAQRRSLRETTRQTIAGRLPLINSAVQSPASALLATQRILPQAAGSLGKLLSFYQAGLSGQDQTGLVAPAREAIQELPKIFAQELANAGLDKVLRAEIEALFDGLTKLYIRPFATRMAAVDRRGPNTKDGPGALYGIDAAARQELDRQAALRLQGIAKDVNRYGALRYDFGPGQTRDPVAQQRDALRKYQREVEAFESRALAFQESQSEEDLKALASARDRVRLAEQELQYRLLARKATITAPSVGAANGKLFVGTSAVAQSQADFFLNTQAALREGFGSTLDSINERRTRRGRERANLDGLLGGLFDGKDDKLAREFLKARGYSADILRDTEKMKQALDQELAALKPVYETYRKIDDEIKEQVKSLTAVEQKLAKQAAPGGRQPSASGFKDTLRNAAALFGGFGIGYTAANAIRTQVQTFLQYEQEIAGIQGVISSKSKEDAARLSAGIGQIAGQYGVSLIETAKAARVLAQSGLEANEVLKELDTTMLAMRGMGMTIEQVEELQVAIRAVTSNTDRYVAGLDYTAATLEKISQVEARYAVESQDLANALKLTLPLVDNFADGMTGMADAIDYTNGLTTVLVERLRITGNQAANINKIFLSRLTRPEILDNLQENFQIKIGTEDGKNILPIDQLIRQLGQAYERLNRENPFQAKQLVTELSGGRNVVAITALLEEYRRVADIASESANAFGNTQLRAAIATDTILTSVEKLRTSMALTTKNFTDATAAGEGLKFLIGGLAEIMRGFGNQGLGVVGVLTTIAVTGGVIQRVRKAYLGLRTAQLAQAAAATASTVALGAEAVAEAQVATNAVGAATGLTTLNAAQRNVAAGAGLVSSAFGTLARFIGPGAVILGVATLAVSLVGLASNLAKAGDEARKYMADVEAIKNLDLSDTPQVQSLRTRAERFRLGTEQDAVATTRRIIVGAPSLAMQEALRELDTATVASQKIVDKFAKAFIEQLPEEARGKYAQLGSDMTRIAEVTALVGEASFAANAQIAKAVDEVREATKRNVEEALAGIDRLDSRGKSILARLALRATGRELQGIIDLRRDRFPERALSNRIRELGPVGEEVANSAAGQRAIANALAPLRGKAQVELAELLERVFSQLYNTAEFRQIVARASGQADAIRAVGADGAQTGRDSLTAAERFRAGFSAATETAANDLVRITQDQLRANNPALTRFAEINERLSTFLQNSGFLDPGVDKDRNRTRTELLSFKDILLEAALAFYDQVRKFRFDEVFARRYGTGFDRGGALVSLGQQVLQSRDQFAGSNQAEIAELQARLASLDQIVRRSKEAGIDLDAKTVESKKLQEEIKTRAAEIARFSSETFDKVTRGNPKIAEDIRAAFQSIFGDPTKGLAKPLEEFLQFIGDALVRVGREQLREDARRLQSLELQKQAITQQNQLLEAQLPVTATLAQRLQLQASSRAALFKAELETIALKRQQGKEDKDALSLQEERLRKEYEMSALYDARLEVARAQQDFERQQATNLEGMLSGFRRLGTDLSIWEQIVAPEGDTSEQRARAKAQAIRTVIFETINPIFKTFTDRVVDNAFQVLQDQLLQSGKLRNLLGGPEVRMKTSIEEASATGSLLYAQAILTASQQAAGVLAQAVGNPLSVGPSLARQGATMGLLSPSKSKEQLIAEVRVDRVAENTTATMQQLAAARRRAMLQGASLLAGQIGGTALGGGGQFAQLGSTIGATAGTLLAPATGGLSLIIPAALGILGGLLGGSADKKQPKPQQDDPVINGLEAVERAQRETITAIQGQTDALLKPENRFFNLPATFTIPAYSPAFAGSLPGGGAGAGTVVQDNRQITIEVNGGDLNEVRRIIDETLGDSLYRSRGTRRR